MVVAAPRYQNRYQPGGLAARCFTLRDAPLYPARSVRKHKIWLRLRGKFLTLNIFR